MAKKDDLNGESHYGGLEEIKTGAGTMLRKTSAHPCSRCTICCTYIVVQLDRPRSRRQISDYIWYLYHKNVNIYLDWDDDWWIQFDTQCEKLSEHGLCGAYMTRPDACREYKIDECERHNEAAACQYFFADADSMIRYLKKHRPHLYKKAQDVLKERP